MEAETLQTESEITKKSLFSSLLSNSIIAAANLLKKMGDEFRLFYLDKDGNNIQVYYERRT